MYGERRYLVFVLVVEGYDDMFVLLLVWVFCFCELVVFWFFIFSFGVVFGKGFELGFYCVRVYLLERGV